MLTTPTQKRLLKPPHPGLTSRSAESSRLKSKKRGGGVGDKDLKDFNDLKELKVLGQLL